jgi:hypothetical protein
MPMNSEPSAAVSTGLDPVTGRPPSSAAAGVDDSSTATTAVVATAIRPVSTVELCGT